MPIFIKTDNKITVLIIALNSAILMPINGGNGIMISVFQKHGIDNADFALSKDLTFPPYGTKALSANSGIWF